jgi:fatty acid/phospholipid biosynthesis enzyme
MVQLSRPSSLSYHPKGALLAGVKGVVVKCHGSASKEGLMAAISQAEAAASGDLTQKLEAESMTF